MRRFPSLFEDPSNRRAAVRVGRLRSLFDLTQLIPLMWLTIGALVMLALSVDWHTNTKVVARWVAAEGGWILGVGIPGLTALFAAFVVGQVRKRFSAWRRNVLDGDGMLYAYAWEPGEMVVVGDEGFFRVAPRSMWRCRFVPAHDGREIQVHFRLSLDGWQMGLGWRQPGGMGRTQGIRRSREEIAYSARCWWSLLGCDPAALATALRVLQERRKNVQVDWAAFDTQCRFAAAPPGSGGAAASDESMAESASERTTTGSWPS